jgi:hypothetical protein
MPDDAADIGPTVDDDDDAIPGVSIEVVGRPDVPARLAGVAASSASIPGTAFDMAAKSSGLVKAFARVNNRPATPAACSGVEPSSFANPFTSSGLAVTAVDIAAGSEDVPRAAWARAPVADENNPTITHTATHTIRGVRYLAIASSSGLLMGSACPWAQHYRTSLNPFIGICRTFRK